MPYAQNGDVSIYYDTLGNSDEPAVLLLGGAGKQSIDWPYAFCDRIVDLGFFVLRFDQRDTGLSTSFAVSKPDASGTALAIAEGRIPILAYHAEDMAADAFAVLDAAGVDQAHLFGRSLGAYVAQLMALDPARRVLSLTLAMAFSRAIGTGMSREQLQGLDVQRFVDATSFADRQVNSARNLGHAAYFDEPAIRAAALLAFERGVPEGSVARHFMVGLAAEDLRPRLGVQQVPTQIIHGRADKVIPLDLAEETAAAIPGARIAILDDMAHEGPPQLWDRWIDLFARNAARCDTAPAV